jgi:thioredoxin-related protein
MSGPRVHQLCCVVLLGLCAARARAADAPVWLRDLDAGKAEANAAGKDLFLLFTGVGWCEYCMILDREVLKQPTFLEQVRKTYTLVELDFTFGDTPAEKEREARFKALQKEYLVNGFPTVVLADADGTPYAVVTGYEPKSGVGAMLEQIARGRAARDERDREFRAAAASDGVDRAAHLHQGIRAVAGQLGTLEERGDDPVLSYYKAQVAEVARLDARGEIRKAYERRRAERDRWVAGQAVFNRLREFDAANDYRGAITFLDEALKTAEGRTIRFRLERARHNFLERDRRYDEALQGIRQMLGRDDLSADERDQLMFREAVNLFNLGRVEEAVAVFDRRIANADTLDKRVRRMNWKASLIPSKTHRDLKLAAWRACRDAAPRGGEEWLEATYFLADEMRKAGRPRDALALFHESLAVERSAGLMTHIAECHLDLGESDQAREWIDRAEAEAAKLKASPRQGEQQAAARVEARVKQLRERLGPG